MKPVIALVGRPNVGKSTLFNRLTRSRAALVADMPGLTRDRQYGEASVADREFILIDTGGITGFEEGIDSAMAAQSLLAIEEATVCFFLVDAREGLTPDDMKIADHLRRRDKHSYLVVNKVDGLDPDQASAEFHQLGLGRLYPVSASQGRGVSAMIEQVLTGLPEPEPAGEGVPGEADDTIRIAFAGRPNVGKSTLVNRMLGEDRVVVYDQPGTTRDSVSIPFERRGRRYELVDTAGIRKRGKTREAVEKFSVVKSLQAIQDSNVVIFVADARQGIVEQDLHLLGYVVESGRALVIAINKWDGMDEDAKLKIKLDIKRRFAFVDFAAVHFISALYGSGVGDLYSSIHKAFASASRKLVTSQLTAMLEKALADHAPPMINGRRIKLKFAHAGGHNPPTVVIHGKQTSKLPGHYRRYLEKSFRKDLKLEGTPVRLEFVSDENPFTAHEKNLSQRQVARKRRLQKNRRASKQVRGRQD